VTENTQFLFTGQQMQ